MTEINQITFSTPFENKLNELSIKEQFVTNWNNNDIKLLSLEELNKCNNWAMFINNAFIWGSTKEGSAYWSNIADLT